MHRRHKSRNAKRLRATPRRRSHRKRSSRRSSRYHSKILTPIELAGGALDYYAHGGGEEEPAIKKEKRHKKKSESPKAPKSVTGKNVYTRVEPSSLKDIGGRIVSEYPFKAARKAARHLFKRGDNNVSKTVAIRQISRGPKYGYIWVYKISRILGPPLKTAGYGFKKGDRKPTYSTEKLKFIKPSKKHESAEKE